MADIDASELKAAVDRIVADNKKARSQGRSQAARLMEALYEADPEAFSDVVEDITNGAIGAIERPRDEQSDDRSEPASGT